MKDLEKFNSEIDDDGGMKKDLFKYVDYLILNEIELETLSGIKIENVIDDSHRASRELMNKHSINVGIIATLGECGVLFTSKKDSSASQHVKCSKVNVVDTTVIINFFLFHSLYFQII